MTTQIDGQSVDLLRGLRGQVIRRVTGARYPGVTGYSELNLVTGSETTIGLTLRVENVDDELEVCVPIARLLPATREDADVDRIELQDFRVARVYKLQRRESIEWSTEDAAGYVGSHPREHLLAELDDGDSPGFQTVDAGVAFESEGGIALEFCADSFPLLFQLHLSVAASSVPSPKKVAII